MGTLTLIPVKKAGADKHTLTGSLQQHGLNRYPGCTVTTSPVRELDGTFRTGLDPEALYIKKMELEGKTEEAAIEKQRVSALREKLEAKTGLDLGPRSDYYLKMGSIKDDPSVGTFATLKDDINIFSDTNPSDEIKAAWLRVHPYVASSYEDYKRNSKPYIMYFISNPEAENKIVFDEKKAINRAIVQLDKATTPTLRKWARILDLPVNDSTPEENVYNQLDNFIKQGTVKQTGAYKGRRAVTVFNDILDTAEDVLNVKDMVKTLLQLTIYRKSKGVIFEGETRISESEQELVAEIMADTQLRIALEKKIKSKKLING